ncbi:MAG: response regulator transcription factor [Steroidobacteraceae bacterium]|nr:response regulator transcription factor [Steroidobacteraceae bacterium]
MKNGTPTVFVIDDDDAVRSSLRLLFKSWGLDAVLAASADEFLAGYDVEHPGCVVLDVRMPGMSGLELQQRLNTLGATIPIIFITGHGDVPMAVEAMQAGAFDFLQKPFRDDDLLERVRRALEHDAAQRARLEARQGTRGRLATLTPRERDVLDLVVVGKANKVIAADLGLSQRTVEIHRARVMEKMDAASLAQLVRMVLDLERPDG